MPAEPEHTSAHPTDVAGTAIPRTEPDAQAPGGYGGRFADDAFDCPSPSAGHAWSAVPAPAAETGESVAPLPVPLPLPVPGTDSGTARGRARKAGDRWLAAVRHRSALTATVALIALAGFGFALFTVGDTVSATPTPGGTAQVSAPKAPPEQPVQPVQPVPFRLAGSAVSAAPPAQTSPLPGADNGREQDGEHGGRSRDARTVPATATAPTTDSRVGISRRPAITVPPPPGHRRPPSPPSHHHPAHTPRPSPPHPHHPADCHHPSLSAGRHGRVHLVPYVSLVPGGFP
ncbi:hypothetical protein [Streptomyces fuscichromogenes]|uniref:Uncharacterized protein n=1 Tax=Streptomyces fuscichromogenes TaxID=1324013 RepID=A0A918CVW7_9ACTN|nr:hypothetical protein [Streptomyces fuscichromogenes]GGN36997.1 hypothetical protein GCM10011578_080820 [Streptomyces fuscichromogenes]